MSYGALLHLDQGPIVDGSDMAPPKFASKRRKRSATPAEGEASVVASKMPGQASLSSALPDHDASSTTTPSLLKSYGSWRATCQRHPALSCIVSCGLALAWLHGVFLRPLGHDAIDMVRPVSGLSGCVCQTRAAADEASIDPLSLVRSIAPPSPIGFQHRQQLDPTEIVAIPYDLCRLGLFVGGTVATAALLRSLFDRVPLSAMASALATDAFLVLLVFHLCGASPTERMGHTAFATVYLTTLATALDPPHFPAASATPSRILDRLYPPSSSSSSSSSSLQYPDKVLVSSSIVSVLLTTCVVVLNVPLMVLRLYDRGYQVQRWPVPVVLATTYGWILGNFLGTIVVGNLSEDKDDGDPARRLGLNLRRWMEPASYLQCWAASAAENDDIHKPKGPRE